MTKEKDLVFNGITWLSTNQWAKSEEIDQPHGKSFIYADKQNRVVRRTLDFVRRSEENLQNFHDWLMANGKTLPKDIFVIFFKIWSKQYSINHPQIISKTYNIGPKVDWIKAAKLVLDNEI